ncbi:MAG: hypothetical protein AAGJ82_10600, partial [Bacteroidota bacterium]
MARKMIIVWSWERSGMGEGTWTTEGNTANKDGLIAVDWLASTSNMARLQLRATQELEQGHEVLLFLHRQHGYQQDHIAELVQKTDIREAGTSFKCFLFGEGADPIYLTQSPRGLLGTAGTLSANVIFEDEMLAITSIADFNTRELKAAHYNYVWQTYTSAFEQRIFQLKADLLQAVFTSSGKAVFGPGEVYNLLRQAEQRELLLRLLSFTGRIRKDSDLAREIRIFERNSNKSLTFDETPQHHKKTNPKPQP